MTHQMDYVEVNTDHKFHRHLIGKRGANINRIKEQDKVSVRVPPDSEKSNLICIEGARRGAAGQGVAAGAFLSRGKQDTRDLIVEQRFHCTIIRQKDKHICEIRNKFPEVIINFLDPAQKKKILSNSESPRMRRENAQNACKR